MIWNGKWHRKTINQFQFPLLERTMRFHSSMSCWVWSSPRAISNRSFWSERQGKGRQSWLAAESCCPLCRPCGLGISMWTGTLQLLVCKVGIIAAEEVPALRWLRKTPEAWTQQALKDTCGKHLPKVQSEKPVSRRRACKAHCLQNSNFVCSYFCCGCLGTMCYVMWQIKWRKEWSPCSE